MQVKIKLLSEAATMPRKATPGSAAYDLFTPRDAEVPAHQRIIIPLDFSLEFPPYVEAKIEPRSGFSAKGILDREATRHDADVLVGKIDSDYRGNVGVIVANHSDKSFIIPAETRIAQMTFYGLPVVDFEPAQHLTQTERADGGFGSTGN